MNILALVILIIFSIAGFVAIFFTTFGTLIILIGILIYSFLTKFSIINFKMLLILFGLYLCGEVLEYFFVIWGAKKMGASNVAVAGAIIGGMLGAIIGSGLLAVGIVAGTFLGIFLGAFLAELIVKKDLKKSLKSGTGGVLGRIGSVAAKVVLAVIMCILMGSKIIAYYF